MKVENFKRFSLKMFRCEARAFPRYGCMISRPFCSWERTFFASSIIAYWPLAAIMPPTKVCPQCKAAV